jgi:hypothetical protein
MATAASGQLQEGQGGDSCHLEELQLEEAYSDSPRNPAEATSTVHKLYVRDKTKPIAVVKVQTGAERDAQVSSSWVSSSCCTHLKRRP